MIMSDEKSKFRIIKFCTFILIGLFVIYNIVWCVFYVFVCRPNETSLGYNEERQDYTLFENNYAYSVGMPRYLDFTYNLAITESIECDENGEPKDGYYFDLLIWPKLFSNDKYGLQIAYYEKGKIDFGSNIYLDNNMNPIDTLSDEDNAAIKNNKDKIKNLYKQAQDKWPSLNINTET